MKLKELFESKFTYQVGDTVKTPFGPGVIEKELEQTEKDVYFNVRILGADNRKKFKLEDKPYRMGSFSLQGIIHKKINEAAAHGKNKGKTYRIHASEYMHEEPYSKTFKGTWRALLIDLTGVDNKDAETYSDEELVKTFNDANGDGQPYYTVYIGNKKVLG